MTAAASQISGAWTTWVVHRNLQPHRIAANWEGILCEEGQNLSFVTHVNIARFPGFSISKTGVGRQLRQGPLLLIPNSAIHGRRRQHNNHNNSNGNSIIIITLHPALPAIDARICRRLHRRARRVVGVCTSVRRRCAVYPGFCPLANSHTSAA